MRQPLPVTETAGHTTCVRRVPVFSRLSPEQQQVVASFASPVALRSGTLLHTAGERTTGLFVVHEGKVKLTHLSSSGRRRLLRVAGPGDVVGEHAFLTGAAPDYEAEALEQTRLCAFSSSDLAKLVAAYPAIATGMLRSLSERLSDADRRLAQGQVEVPVRLAAFLLDQPLADGARVRLPWPKKDVASYLGTTPESLSRAFDRLQRAGMIQVHGPAVELLDPGALEALAEPAW